MNKAKMTRSYNVLGETRYTLDCTINGNEITYIIEKGCGAWALSWIYTGDDFDTESMVDTYATKKEAIEAMNADIELENSTEIAAAAIDKMVEELGISHTEATHKYFGITV